MLAALLGGGARLRAADVDPGALRDSMQQFCFRCHGGEKVKGKVDLVKAFDAKPQGLAGDLDLMETMIDALQNREMPPDDEKQPTEAQRNRWITKLETTLNAQLSQNTKLARVPIRRMNRLEYNNAVKTLFDLSRDPFPLPERTVRDVDNYFHPASGKMPPKLIVGNRALGKSQFVGAANTLPGVAAFPKDNRAEHGFDNRADHLTMSPLLMESFFALSRSILDSPKFAEYSRNYKSLFEVDAKLSVEAQRAEGRKRLAGFLRRAFRSDVSGTVVDRYHARFAAKLDAGSGFTDAMKAAISPALVSPRFLYLHAGSDKPTDHDFALASRLSTFLWNDIPDDALLDIAAQGKLRDPAVLAAQVDRMVNDRKVKNLCDTFAMQWLQLDLMVAAMPDVGRYREYYYSGANKMIYRVGMHMMVEPLLLFETVLVENRSVTELIDPDFTYRSKMLREWYTLEPKQRGGSVVNIRFEREPITDRRWGGVITNAAVMTMTSSPLRTKPITRGAWLTTAIFNDPPKPPPADVPEIEDDDEKLEATGLTLRETLKNHIANPQCATCHKKIDPLGFALEHYDPVGRWRDTYRTGLEIDASGKLFGRHDFNSPAAFKDAILAERERFVRAFAGHLLSYGLGRALDAGDRPSLDTIVANAAQDGYRLRTIIREVVLSDSFTRSSIATAEDKP